MHTLRLTKFHQLLLASLVVALGLVLFAGSARAATYTVTNTNDSGAGSLRAAIISANASTGVPDTIEFNIAGAGVQTISLASALPSITDTLTIDGTTQTGASCGDLVPESNLPANSNTPHTLLIEINRTADDVYENILSIDSGAGEDASNSSIRGLIINSGGNNSSFQSIFVQSNSGDMDSNISIDCNYVGTNSTGTSTDPSTIVGIYVSAITGINIFNNLISTTSGNIMSFGSSVNIVENLIGTDAAGNTSIGQGEGVNVSSDGAVGPSSISHNVISGHAYNGITISGNTFTINGNFIGLALNGSVLGNGNNGIFVGSGSSDYTIGGVDASDRNVISANYNGIHIYNFIDFGDGCPISTNTVGTIIGNYIGTTPSGTVQTGYGNLTNGIQVNEVTDNTSCVSSVYKIQIGGSETGNSNVIAGNTQDGVRIFQPPAGDVFSVNAIENSIHSNGNLGINLAADEADTGEADADIGPNPLNNNLMTYPAVNANYYLNRPTINTASFSGNDISVNYDFQANAVQANSPYLENSDLVGYRLDFYLNDAGQDGAYAGYSQGKTHIGSFVVNGSETNATHTFTSPVAPTAGQVVTATATVLWAVIDDVCRVGNGPPYTYTCD